MKFKINFSGILELKRGHYWKQQLCPVENNQKYCGDSCPFFGEPSEGFEREWVLHICEGRFIGPFVDERPEPKPKVVQKPETVQEQDDISEHDLQVEIPPQPRVGDLTNKYSK